MRRCASARRSWRDIIETMPAMAFVTDASGRNAIGNRRWDEYTGLGPDAANSKAAVHPEDASRYKAARNHSIATGEAFEEEVRLRRWRRASTAGSSAAPCRCAMSRERS